MIDVARLANVSVATVSRVLSEPKSVKDSTRQKVLDAIAKLCYEPNILGRQLRTKETRMIMVVIPDITNTFFSKIIRGIQSVAFSSGYQVLLGDTGNTIRREAVYMDLLKQKHMDGIILLTAKTDKLEMEKIAKRYPIVVACEYLANLQIPTVSINNVKGARTLVERLVLLGHRRIAHISGPVDSVLSNDRYTGYRLVMEENYLYNDGELVMEGDFTIESGYRAMVRLLESGNRPTAVFAANDAMAIGAIKCLKERKIRVPEHIAIAGFDDSDISVLYEPALTTIATPTFQLGEEAMKLLLAQLRGEEISNNKIVLDSRLEIRSSC
jgi:LacI family repressor for deo operon, udp, cdd, tsx, nupC, and nupG